MTYREYLKERVNHLETHVKEMSKALDEDDVMGVGILTVKITSTVDHMIAECHFVTPNMLDLEVQVDSRMNRS